MLVAVLIGIMISIVVGVSLVPTIVASTTGIQYAGHVWVLTPTPAHWTSTTLSAPAGLQALADVLPYVFVAVILLGAVAWIGGQG